MVRHVFADALRSWFGNASIVRAHKIYLGILAASILIWWPSNHFSFFIQFGSRPATFSIASFVVLAGMSYFSYREPRRQRGVSPAYTWMRHGNASPLSYFVGVMLFLLFHLMILIGMSLPILLASLAVSGVDIATCLDVGAVIILFVFTISIWNHAALALLPERGGIRFLIHTVILLTYLLLSVRWFPQANPVITLQSLIAGEGSTALISAQFGTDAFRLSALRSGVASLSVALCAYGATLGVVSFGIRRSA